MTMKKRTIGSGEVIFLSAVLKKILHEVREVAKKCDEPLDKPWGRVRVNESIIAS